MNDANAIDRPGTTTKFRSAWLLGPMLVLLVAGVYWPTLSNAFIWDDDSYVEDNLYIRSLEGVRLAWFQWGATPQYYPLVHSLFYLEYRLWGLDPWGYHAVNMALFAVCVILLWRLLLRLKVPGAWLAAAMFAVHPLEVETVAWVTEAKNLLSLALALGSMLAYLQFMPPEGNLTRAENVESGAKPATREGWWYELSLVLFIAGLLSKTVVASMPAVLLVIYWWKRGRITSRDVALLSPFFVFGVVLGYVTVHLEKVRVGAEGAEWNFTFVERVLLAGRALWFYVGKLFWPHPLIFFYPRWTPDTSQWWEYLFPAAALALPIVLWTLRRRIGRGPLAAALIFGGVLFPALGFFNVYPFRFSFVADHFQFHAGIALIVLVAGTLATLWQRLPRIATWLAPVACIALLAPLAIVARQQTAIYYNLVTLYEHTIALNSQGWLAPYNLGAHLHQLGRRDEAIRYYRESMRRVPREDWARNVGAALRYAENQDEAVEVLNRAIASEMPAHQRAAAESNLANILAQRHQFEEAIVHQKAALKLWPANVAFATDLGAFYLLKGDQDGALQTFAQAVELNQNYAPAHNSLGNVLLQLNRPDDAMQSLLSAVKLRPKHAGYREDLGIALLKTGNLLEAEKQLRYAILFNPNSPNAHNTLGAVLSQWGDVSGAVAEFQEALRLDPNDAQAAANLNNAAQTKPPVSRPAGSAP